MGTYTCFDYQSDNGAAVIQDEQKLSNPHLEKTNEKIKPKKHKPSGKIITQGQNGQSRK